MYVRIQLAHHLSCHIQRGHVSRNGKKSPVCNRSTVHYRFVSVSGKPPNKTKPRHAFKDKSYTYQAVVKEVTTLSPFLISFTCSPTSTTSPVNSWPIIKPDPAGSMPRKVWSSLSPRLVYIALYLLAAFYLPQSAV